eukprot:Hpha_TRINITY_DN13362_c0_g2::TRINITY_DN13362_c0_g2_i1::g.95600::m.95600
MPAPPLLRLELEEGPAVGHTAFPAGGRRLLEAVVEAPTELLLPADGECHGLCLGGDLHELPPTRLRRRDDTSGRGRAHSACDHVPPQEGDLRLRGLHGGVRTLGAHDPVPHRLAEGAEGTVLLGDAGTAGHDQGSLVGGEGLGAEGGPENDEGWETHVEETLALVDVLARNEMGIHHLLRFQRRHLKEGIPEDVQGQAVRRLLLLDDNLKSGLRGVGNVLKQPLLRLVARLDLLSHLKLLKLLQLLQLHLPLVRRSKSCRSDGCCTSSGCCCCGGVGRTVGGARRSGTRKEHGFGDGGNGQGRPGRPKGRARGQGGARQRGAPPHHNLTTGPHLGKVVGGHLGQLGHDAPQTHSPQVGGRLTPALAAGARWALRRLLDVLVRGGRTAARHASTAARAAAGQVLVAAAPAASAGAARLGLCLLILLLGGLGRGLLRLGGRDGQLLDSVALRRLLTLRECLRSGALCLLLLLLLLPQQPLLPPPRHRAARSGSRRHRLTRHIVLFECVSCKLCTLLSTQNSPPPRHTEGQKGVVCWKRTDRGSSKL